MSQPMYNHVPMKTDMLELVHRRFVCLPSALHVWAVSVAVLGVGVTSRKGTFCCRSAQMSILSGYVFGEEWSDRLAC